MSIPYFQPKFSFHWKNPRRTKMISFLRGLRGIQSLKLLGQNFHFWFRISFDFFASLKVKQHESHPKFYKVSNRMTNLWWFSKIMQFLVFSCRFWVIVGHCVGPIQLRNEISYVLTNTFSINTSNQFMHFRLN